MMKCRMLSGALAAAVSAAIVLPAGAQLNQPNQLGNRTNQQRRPAPKNYFEDLKTIATSLGQKNNVKIVVDPAIFVAVKPTPPMEGVALPGALSALTSQLKKVAWKRVYLTQVTGPNIPAPEKLAASVRSLDQVEQMGLVLENPVTRRATSFVKEFEVPANFVQALQDQQFNPEPIYVIYSTIAGAEAGKSPEDRFFDLQKEQMDMMMQMSPDELQQSMARGMELWNQMDPATRSAFMGQMMKAGMQMFNNMPDAQKQQLMQDALQNAQQFFGGAAGGNNGRKPPL